MDVAVQTNQHEAINHLTSQLTMLWKKWT